MACDVLVFRVDDGVSSRILPLCRSLSHLHYPAIKEGSCHRKKLLARETLGKYFLQEVFPLTLFCTDCYLHVDLERPKLFIEGREIP